MTEAFFNAIGLAVVQGEWLPITKHFARLAFEGGWPLTPRVTDAFDFLFRVVLSTNETVRSETFNTTGETTFRPVDGDGLPILAGARILGFPDLDGVQMRALSFDPLTGTFDAGTLEVFPEGGELTVIFVTENLLDMGNENLAAILGAMLIAQGTTNELLQELTEQTPVEPPAPQPQQDVETLATIQETNTLLQRAQKPFADSESQPFRIKTNTDDPMVTAITANTTAVVALSNAFARAQLSRQHPDSLPVQVVSSEYVDPGPLGPLRVFLQGAMRPGGAMGTELRDTGLLPVDEPYEGGTQSFDGYALEAGVVDWVLLRFTPNGADYDDYKVGFLLSDGRVVEPESVMIGAPAYAAGGTPIASPVTGDYQVAVIHRNHVAIQTPNTLQLIAGLQISYDFTTAQEQAFQFPPEYEYPTAAMKALSNGSFAMWAGSANGDSNVQHNDLVALQDAISAGTFDETYCTQDLNLNGFVDNQDIAIYNGNTANDTTVIFPHTGM